MNFDKASKSDFFFFFGGGGGRDRQREREKRERERERERERGAGEEGNSNQKQPTKNHRYSLMFCADALYKISCSWLKWVSSFTQTVTDR